MKYVHVYAFFLMLFFHTSYAQNETNVPKDNTETSAIRHTIYNLLQRLHFYLQCKSPAQEGSKVILLNQF